MKILDIRFSNGHSSMYAYRDAVCRSKNVIAGFISGPIRTRSTELIILSAPKLQEKHCERRALNRPAGSLHD